MHEKRNMKEKYAYSCDAYSQKIEFRKYFSVNSLHPYRNFQNISSKIRLHRPAFQAGAWRHLDQEY